MSSRAVDGSAVARMRQSYDLQLDGLDERKPAGPERDQRRAEADGECDEKLAQAGERVAEGSSLQLSFSGYDVRLGRPESSHDWSDRLSLSDPPRTGRRRHGRGVPRRGHEARTPGRAQGAAAAIPPHDPDRRARFEREARAVAALNHPDIVTIHSVEEHQGVLFLTMELVEGQTLSECIPQGGLPLDQLLEIGIPLADAVGAAHQRGITHRDLKPANVMVGHDGRVKVLDFGLAKQQPQDSFQDETALVATSSCHGGRQDSRHRRLHVARAGARASPSIRARTSSRSASCCTRWRPASGRSRATRTSRCCRRSSRTRRRSSPICRSDLPRDLGRIVKRCLAKDPEERYQTAKDLRNDLKALKEDSDSARDRRGGSHRNAGVRRLRAGHGGGRNRGATRRGSRWIWIAAAAVVVLAAGAFAARWASPPPQPRVTATRQITTDGAGNPSPMTDGSRLYFGIARIRGGRDGGSALAQVVGLGRRHRGARCRCLPAFSTSTTTGTELLV